MSREESVLSMADCEISDVWDSISIGICILSTF